MKKAVKKIWIFLSIAMLNMSCSSAWKITEDDIANNRIKGNLIVYMKDGSEIKINRENYKQLSISKRYLYMKKDKLDSIKVNLIDKIKEERFSLGKTFIVSLGVIAGIILIITLFSGGMFVKFT